MKKTSTFLSLLSVVLLLAVVLGVLFFINPMQAQIDDLSASLQTKETEVADLSAKIADLTAMQDELGVSGVSQEKLLLSVPEGAEQDELIKDLSGVANSAGVDLHGMSFSMIEGDVSGVITISASFDGDYEDLMGFLEELEGNTRKINVKSISVQLSEEDAVAKASFSLLMEAYYQ